LKNCGTKKARGESSNGDSPFSFEIMIAYQKSSSINPNVAKAGGLQRQGVKGEAVVAYCDPLTTQDLKSSGFPVG